MIFKGAETENFKSSDGLSFKTCFLARKNLKTIFFNKINFLNEIQRENFHNQCSHYQCHLLSPLQQLSVDHYLGWIDAPYTQNFDILKFLEKTSHWV
jgi:hypothetical protein